jgi:serine/threonine protein kinase
MWQNQGLRTLGSLYDCADSFMFETLSESIRSSAGTSKLVIIKSFLKDMALKLAKLHSIGIVHRDVKPENILLTEDGPVFIDLGASASCLTNLVNYYPGSGPADPLFSVQNENFLIPEDAPPPTNENAAELWLEYKPDRFDAFSMGIILLQLCVEPLRDKDNLRNFIRELEKCELDLYAWRSASAYPPGTFELLESEGDSGWELASSLVCARHDRLSLADMTSHRFFGKGL